MRLKAKNTVAAVATVATVAAPVAPVATVAAPVAAPVLSPRAIARETHNAANFTGNAYDGISKTRNGDIAKPVALATSKSTARTYAQLTPRMHATLSELAKTYGDKAFPLIGIDRGQAAIFINSGFFVTVSETTVNLSNETLARYGK